MLSGRLLLGVAGDLPVVTSDFCLLGATLLPFLVAIFLLFILVINLSPILA